MSIQTRMIAMSSVEALRRDGCHPETAMRLVWKAMRKAETAPKVKDEPKQIAAPKPATPRKRGNVRPRAVVLERQDMVAALCRAGKSRGQIAAQVGLTVRGVDDCLRRLGMRTQPTDTPLLRRRAEIARMHRDGKTNRQMADALEITVNAVEHSLRIMGLKYNPAGNGKALGVDLEARRMRVAAMTADGMTPAQIQAAMGISKAQCEGDRVYIARFPERYAPQEAIGRPESAQVARYAIRARETQDRTVSTSERAA